MNIILVHNRYIHAGGEDTVVQTENALLQARGHQVVLFEARNDGLDGAGTWQQGQAALRAIYSPAARRELAALIATHRPQVVHVHNFFPRLSPSIYDACRAAGVAVVQTLHNYRLLCVNALLFRDGRVCEDCLGKALPWPGVWHACYRTSRAASATVAAMLGVHRALETWSRKVDRFIALTEFARSKFIEGGLPPDQIVVKPNLVYPTPECGQGRGGYALFVGRLSVEKGIEVLLAAWEQLGGRVPLKIVGDGPLAPQVQAASKRVPGLEWCGPLSRERVLELMQNALVLVFPSVWYEMFSMSTIEALSVGLPVITSNLGSMSALIAHDRTGRHFRPGDAADLAAQVEWVLAHPQQVQQMRLAARAEFEANHTPTRNYEMLAAIYQQAIDHARARQ